MDDDGFDELGYCEECFAKIPFGEMQEVNSKWVCKKCEQVLRIPIVSESKEI